MVISLKSLIAKTGFPFTKSEPRSMHKIGMAPSMRGMLTKQFQNKNEVGVAAIMLAEQSYRQ